MDSEPEQHRHRVRLDTEALVLGYAMSRLDAKYLADRGLDSWREAFGEAAQALERRPATFKNLRDEFDPIHQNPRAGWRNRPLRRDRERVIEDLSDVSDEALMELVRRIVSRKTQDITEAIDSLSATTSVAYNVAERLLTGRRAEEYFLEHCFDILRVERTNILDRREAAAGYDFGVANDPRCAIEVKGLKRLRGDVLFTDREWQEARHRASDYFLVVIGNLAASPVPHVVTDPSAKLDARCCYQSRITATWESSIWIEPPRAGDVK